jgi:ribosomal protein S12 methylthiotransferase accessory factor
VSPDWPLSIGCAAGPTAEAAALHGLLELVERDAAALWWRGGRRGRLPPLDDAATEAAAGMLRALRRDAAGRRSWLLDITTELGIPCIAAVSCGPDGRGFCCGTAAGLTLAAAAEAALREMCQMELAHEVVQAKRRERGDEALNEVDRRHAARFTGIDAAGCTLLHPLPPAFPARLPEAGDAPLRLLAERLAGRGLPVFTVNLSAGDNVIPVVRVLCPGLQPEPSASIGERLLAAIAATGGGDTYTGRIPLM